MRKIRVITLNPAIDITYDVSDFVPHAVNRVNYVWRMPGGKGINVLRVLHQLGISDVAGYGILAGSAGTWIARHLEKEGITFTPFWADGETRSTIAVLGKDSKDATELIEPGPEVSSKIADEFAVNLEKWFHKDDYVLISGSQPRGLPIDYTGTIIRIAKEQGCQVAVDTSGSTLEASLQLEPDVVKVNHKEFSSWMNSSGFGDKSLVQGARRLLDRGVSFVVVTRGRNGSVAVSHEGGWVVSTAPVPVLNPVGSGDAFFAGLMSGIGRGMSLKDALVQGTACGASNATFPVAGMIDDQQISKLSATININEM